MDKRNRFKNLILFMAFSILPVMVISLYGLSIYTVLYDCLVDITTLVDITKWQRMNYG